jgi:hypothetical protein
LTLVFGLVTVSIIPVITSLSLFFKNYNLRDCGGAVIFTVLHGSGGTLDHIIMA